MGVFKRKDIWYIDYYDAEGKRHRERIGKSKKQADIILSKREVQVVEGTHLNVRKKQKILLDDWIKEYEEAWKTENKSWYSRKYIVAGLLLFFKGKHLHEIKEWDIKRYRGKRKKDGVKLATINRELSVLRDIIYDAIDKYDLNIKNPLRGKIKNRLEPQDVWELLHQDEFYQLMDYFSHPEKQTAKQKSEQPNLPHIIYATVETGLRLSDLTGMELNQIDFRTKTIDVVENKTGKPRRIVMSENLTKCLKSIKKPKECKWVFPNGKGDKIKNFRKAFYTALERAGVKKIRPTDLRHAVASWLTMEGATLSEVQDFMGHIEITTTQRYTHLSPEHNEKTRAKLEGILSGGGNVWSQIGHKRQSEKITNMKKVQ